MISRFEIFIKLKKNKKNRTEQNRTEQNRNFINVYNTIHVSC